MLAALTGNPEEASCSFNGRDRMAATELVTARATYLRLGSVVSLATGDLEAARQESAEAVSADPTGINSPHVSGDPGARLPLAARRGGCARALAAMKAFRGRWMAASAAHRGGRVGRPRRTSGGGGRGLPGAIEAWRSLECTLDLALCELDLVLLFGPDHPDATRRKKPGTSSPSSGRNRSSSD